MYTKYRTILDLWRLQTSWTTGLRHWHLQSLCDKDASYFSRILNFFGRSTGPCLPGALGLSPASPIVNLAWPKGCIHYTKISVCRRLQSIMKLTPNFPSNKRAYVLRLLPPNLAHFDIIPRASIAVFFPPTSGFCESIWVSRFNFEKSYQIWVFFKTKIWQRPVVIIIVK